MDKKVIEWLLAGPPWLTYAVELQLLNSQPDVQAALNDAGILRIVRRLKGSEAGIPAIKTGKVHYTETGKAYWDLFFLADIGLTVHDCGLEQETRDIFRFQRDDGHFTFPPNVKDNYFCMSAILLSSMSRMGYRDDPRVMNYIRAIMISQMPGSGWDCYDERLGNLESCPMDDMNILMLLGQYPQYIENPALNGAIDCLLEHWEDGEHLYGFGVGKRFRSLQYPAVKYGILRVLDVLSLFPYAVKSKSFNSMLDFVRGKASDGKYFAEEAGSSYSEFDFGQTKEPSRWITFLVNRIEKRAGE